MLQKWLRPPFHALCLALILLAAAPPVPGFAVPLQQMQPPAECLSDQGHPVEPRADIANGWVMVLNFNHIPSTKTTVGCVVSRTNGKELAYTLIECTIQNNLRPVTVGGGSASFDGNFWLQCPGVQWGISSQTDFDVVALAQFAGPGTYTLMEHLDAGVEAQVDGDWHVGLHSRYGQSSFAHLDSQTSAQGQQLALLSMVADQVGLHGVNGQALLPPAKVETFVFDSDQPITIGGAGQVWTLSELIIDPAGRCCR
jgi:hypothetical protein